MKWISFKDKKPDYCQCLVVNVKYGMQVFQAMYHPPEDVFIKLDFNDHNTIPLDVTHYIQIPELPGFEK